MLVVAGGGWLAATGPSADAALVAAPAAVRTAGFAAPCAFAACAASGIGAGAPRSALALVVDAPISRLFAAHGDGRLDVVCSSLSRRSVTCPLSPRCS